MSTILRGRGRGGPAFGSGMGGAQQEQTHDMGGGQNPNGAAQQTTQSQLGGFANGRGGGRGGGIGGGGGRGGFNLSGSGEQPLTQPPSESQQQFNGFAGGRGGRGGRGGFNSGGNDQPLTQPPSESQQQFNGFAGGRGGRGGRGGFNSGGNDQPLTQPPSESQQQQLGGRGGGMGGRGGRGGFNLSGNGQQMTQPSDSQQQFNARGRGGGRGGRGGTMQAGGNESTGPNLGGDIQPQGFGRGRGGRGGGSGRGGPLSGTGPIPSEQPSLLSTLEAARRGGGRGGPMGGRNFRTGANAEPIAGGQNEENNAESRRIGGRDRGDDDRERKPPSRYVPSNRPVDDLYREDEEHQAIYLDITNADDPVSISHGPKLEKELNKIEDWNELDLDPKLKENIMEKSRYIRPRKIQSYVIPYVLNDIDVKCLSETGSGKTGAFMIPLIQKIIKIGADTPPTRVKPSPFALIIEPTRELCLQVCEQGTKLANGTLVTVAKAYGQYETASNIAEIRRGCHILCATPGRLIDFIENRVIDLSKLHFLVLDEADRMLESGFLDDIRKILALREFPTKENRQTLLYSATFPIEIQELANEVVRDNHIMASNKKLVAPNARVEHIFIQVQEAQKTEVLLELLKGERERAQTEDPANSKLRRTLVFVQTCRDANKLALYLVENSISAMSINSDRTQQEREMALSKFRKDEVNVIVATDVMCRGIDIKDLDHVINYDMPPEGVTFVHRIGRTGRLTTGYATSLVDMSRDGCIVKELIEMLHKAEKPIPTFFIEDGRQDDW